MSRPSLVSATLSSARALVALQLLSRLVTFSLNNALIRVASPEVFGTAAVQFDLIGSTLLFLSREGIRGALLRSSADSSSPESSEKEKSGSTAGEESSDRRSLDARRQQDLNLSLVPLPIFLVLGTILVPIYYVSSARTTTSQPFFGPSLALHLLAYLLELLSEPYHIRLQNDLNLGVRVRAEGTAVVLKAVGTLASVWLLGQRRALLAFGLGQVAYGGSLLARFSVEFGRDAGRMWWPHRVAVIGGDARGCAPLLHPAYIAELTSRLLSSYIQALLGPRVFRARKGHDPAVGVQALSHRGRPDDRVKDQSSP